LICPRFTLYARASLRLRTDVDLAVNGRRAARVHSTRTRVERRHYSLRHQLLQGRCDSRPVSVSLTRPPRSMYYTFRFYSIASDLCLRRSARAVCCVLSPCRAKPKPKRAMISATFSPVRSFVIIFLVHKLFFFPYISNRGSSYAS